LLLLGGTCFGQQLSFKHLTTAEGLQSDLRLTMAEDRLGRLWIGSDEGVNVFDGYELGSFSQPDKSGLASNNIQTIFCDKAGTIWIKSLGGVQYKKEAETKFTSLSSSEKDIENTRFFGQTTNGDLACLTNDDIYIVDAKLRVTRLAAFSALMKKHSSPLTFDHFKNNEWFIGFGRNLVLVDIVKQKIIGEYNYRAAWTVCRIDDSTVLAGSFARDTVSIIHVNSGLMEPINNWATSDGLPVSGFTGTIARVANNKYVLGCRLYGIYIVDIEKKYAQHYSHEASDPTSLLSKFCRRLFVSSKGTLFVHTRGISYTQLDTPQINTVKYLTTDKGEKYDAGFTDFVKDGKGVMWISTNSGLAKWDRTTNLCKMYPFFNPKDGPQRFRTVRAVRTDKNDRVWVFTFGGGMGMLKPDGTYEQFRDYMDDTVYAGRSREIQAAAQDGKGNFIICSNGGFIYFDPIEKKATTFIKHPKLKTIATKTTFGVTVDNKNNWWISQVDGLYYYDWSLDSLYDITVPGFNKGNISFYSVVQDAEGNIYAGSTRGLFEIKKGSFKPEMILSKKNGLPSDNIMGLFFDKPGSLWILGNQGLARYNNKSHVLQNFDGRDGAEISNHYLMNYYVAPDGEIFIGTSNSGFNHFFPDKLASNKHPLTVFITSVAQPDSVINISGNFDFSFTHDQNNLNFSFVTVDFSIAPLVQYRYKLAGFDTSFIYAGRQRMARYTNLGAGSYTFYVEASANGRDWYPAPNPVHVKIKEAFWNTWWFRLLGLAFVLTLVYITYKYRITQINKAAHLKAEYEIKLNELEISALRTQMNPHFIFNSLNTINSFINSNDRTQANQYISKFSRLIRLILDHSRQKKISMADELSVVELYMQMEQIRFENKFVFQVIKDTALDMDIVEIPPLIIQPFVENAILHGLLPSGIPGVLNVSITKEENRIVCSIEDNGIGREKAKLNKKQDGVKRESHGMEITLKRIDLFNRENGLIDAVKIIDLKDPTGTKVIIPLALVESF
jgi:ligand-binding sensor domain-containing protein